MKKNLAVAGLLLITTIVTITVVYALDAPTKNMIAAGNHYYNKSIDFKESVFDYNQKLQAEESLTVPISGTGVFDPFRQYEGIHSDIQHGAVLTNNFTMYLRTQFLGIGEDAGSISYNGIHNVSDELYFPLVSTKGDRNSAIYYFNAGDSNAVTRVYCYNEDGSLKSSWKENESPGERERDAIAFYNQDEWEGSVVVTSTQPMAAVMAITNEDLSSMAYGGTANTSNYFYLPLIYDGQSGWSSNIRIQNASGGIQQIGISYYDESGSHIATLTNAVMKNGSYHPAIPPGSVCAMVQGDDKLAVAVSNENHTGELWGYEGGEKKYYPFLPLLIKNANGFNSSFIVQNANSSACDISWQYFNQDGTEASAESALQTIPAWGTHTVDLETDATISNTSSFMGTARIEATQNVKSGKNGGTTFEVAAVVKHASPGGVAGTIYTDNYINPGKSGKRAADDPWENTYKYYYPLIYGIKQLEEAAQEAGVYIFNDPLGCFIKTLRD